MKLLVLFVCIYSCLSIAKTRVGEWAAYDYEEATPSSSIKGTLIKEIVEEKRMQSIATGKVVNHVRISEKLVFGSEGYQAKDTSKWIPESEYLNGFELNVYVAKCRFWDDVGTIEKVKVKAGQFTSCRLKNQDIWIGVVPFNDILNIYNDGQTFRRYELVKFAWKKKPGER